MSTEFTYHPDACLLLPLLVVSDIKCEQCDRSHGWALTVGWLFWEFSLCFDDPNEDTL